MSIKFELEWQSTEDVRAEELRATWCRLGIVVDGRSVTLLEDESGATRKSIYVSAYPLAEWIAFNWYRLRFDGRVSRRGVHWDPGRRGQGSLIASSSLTHNLLGAAEGFPWPDLTFVPDGIFTEVIWRDSGREARGGVRYLTSGAVALHSAEVERDLAAFVENVIIHLQESGITRTPLQDEWEALTRLDADQSSFAEALARLGLDPFEQEVDLNEAVLAVGNELPEGLWPSFFDAADPALLSLDAAWLGSALEVVERLPSPDFANPSDLASVIAANQVQEDPGRPWVSGLEVARALRAEFGLPPTQPFEIEKFVRFDATTTSAGRLQGLGSSTSGCRLVANRSGSIASRRFSMARALWHTVARPKQSHFLVTRALTFDQKTSRAFAAELLAPAAGLEMAVMTLDGVVEYSDIESLARRYGVHPLTVEHQIENNVTIPVSVL